MGVELPTEECAAATDSTDGGFVEDGGGGDVGGKNPD